MYLADFTDLSRSWREQASGFCGFRTSDAARTLAWPDDVLEQWLYDHSGHDPFLRDYGKVDLSCIRWNVEVITTDLFSTLETGPSEAGTVDYYAENPEYWIDQRQWGKDHWVRLMWEVHGTWKRWPLLIERSVLDPTLSGLQVVEGRTRVGILRGRQREGSFHAPQHLAWVGRSSPD